MTEAYPKAKLTEYLKKNIKKGYPIETLRIALVNQGYSRATVDEVIKDVMNQIASEAPVIKEKPQIEHEIVTEEVPEPVVKKTFWQKIFGKK